MIDETDPIWGEMPAEVSIWKDGGREVHCARSGGRYRVTGSVLDRVRQLDVDAKARLTTWIVDRSRFGDDIPVIDSAMLEGRLSGLSPLSAGQQMDRLLLYLSTLNLRPGQKLDWLGSHQQTPETLRLRQEAMAWVEAHIDNELTGIRELLESTGMLSTEGRHVRVTANGFARMEELRRGAIASDQAFVAMWFGEEMSRVYDEAIEPAIRETGFQPLRIDRKEHNNKIDDEIIAEIQRSRFVIADFTCGQVMADGQSVHVPRGGVYYEAGYAQGLRLPVIWSVSADQIEAVHFDTRQFNHIAWDSAADFKYRLINRIRATFSDAP